MNHLLNIENGENHQFHICNNDELNVKKLIDGGENIGNGKTEKVALNLNNKILHSEFHPKKNCFALGCTQPTSFGPELASAFR